LLGAVLTTSIDAFAFCRATTCNEEKEPCERDEHQCKKSGAPKVWPRLPIEFRFSAQRPGQLIREEARAAIRAAFYRWSDTLCGPDQRRTSLRFVEREDIPVDKPLVPKAHGAEPYGIYFRDRGWPYEGKEDSTLAQTNIEAGKNRGVIDYADIEINTGTKRFSTKEEDEGIDLQAVITHEVGHYIGLDHSDDPTSIMAPSYCEKAGRCEKGKVAARRLAQDDIDAVCMLYPPDGLPDPPESGSSCVMHRPSESSAPIVWAPLAAVVLALGARLVRRP
jgi:hypothetical protein